MCLWRMLQLQRSQGSLCLWFHLTLCLAVGPSLVVVVLGMVLVPGLLPTVVRWLGTSKMSRLLLVVFSSRW